MAHHSPLKERKENILKNIKFDMQWQESEPKDVYWTSDDRSWNLKCSESPFRQLRKEEISIAHKHIEIYKDIVKNSYERSLILEDDILLAKDFENLFNIFLKNTPIDWDFIFIGSGCGLRINQNHITQDQTAYKCDPPRSKCVDSYCITLNAAKKILSTIIPFSLPIDFELNYQMISHNMNCYWWEPPLTAQGSQCGIYNSSIQK